MATFKAIVKTKRKDGFYPVYIRVSHRRKLAYIPTDKFVRDNVLSRTGEIEDPYVLQYCSRKIIEFVEALNKVDTELSLNCESGTFLHREARQRKFRKRIAKQSPNTFKIINP